MSIEEQIYNFDNVSCENLMRGVYTFEKNNDNYVLFFICNENKIISSFEKDDYEFLAYNYIVTKDGNIGKLIEIDRNDDERWDIVTDVYLTLEENALLYA